MNRQKCSKKESDEKFFLYIRNLKYCTVNTIFRQHNIHLVFSTCQHKYKWILCTENPVLNTSFQARFLLYNSARGLISKDIAKNL